MTCRPARHYTPTSTRVTLMAIAIGLLAGCATVHDNTPPRALVAVERAQLADDIKLVTGAWPAADWWHRYDDPQLDDLVARALRDSPSLHAADARIGTARAAVEAAHATGGFKLGGVAGALVLRNSTRTDIDGIPVPVPIPGLGSVDLTFDSTLGFAGVAGVYKFDFWGQERAVLDAAIGAHNAALTENALARLELATLVTRTYFDLQVALRQAALLEEMQTILVDMETGVQAREARGLVTETRVAGIRVQRLQASQLLSAARTEAVVLREVLRSLVGAGNDDFPAIAARPLPSLQPTLPSTLGYELLSRRADLVALRWYVQASLDQITAARAAFYPTIDIKAFLGLTHLVLPHLLRSTAGQFALLPGITLPIFDGGLLNANLLQARSGSNVLVERYNQAVLDAVRDVAVAANTVQGLQRQDELGRGKRDAIGLQVADAGAREDRGLVARVDARAARLPLLQEEVQLVGLQGRGLAAEVALVRALGGGFDPAAHPLPAARMAQ